MTSLLQWPFTAPVEPLHFLAIQETDLEYPGQVLWAVATALTTGETPPSRASNLDGVLALLLVFLSAEKVRTLCSLLPQWIANFCVKAFCGGTAIADRSQRAKWQTGASFVDEDLLPP